MGHHGPVLVGHDLADEAAEHAGKDLIGWSSGLFVKDIDRIVLITAIDADDPYVRDLQRLIHAHRAVQVGDDEDEQYLRGWMGRPF